MIIFPLSHENMTVQRWPWVSTAIVVVCIGAFITGEIVGSDSPDEEIEQVLNEVVAYKFRRPYLELDPRLAHLPIPRLGTRKAETDALDHLNQDIPAWVKEAEQAQLDALCARVFELMERRPANRFGFVPAEKRWWTLITSMFMHAGLLHLLGNLFFFYLSGPFIEDVWGRPLFAGFYLTAGIAAALGFTAHFPDSTVPLIGASGAIAGVMGAFFVRYWWVEIRFFYWIGIWWRGTFTARAWVMLPVWLLGELFSAWLFSSRSGVAYWAHVWGFVFGMLFALVMRGFKVEDRWLRPRLSGEVTVKVHPAIQKADEALQAGRGDEALALLRAELQRNPAELTLAVRSWQIAVELGRAGEAVPAFLRVFRNDLQHGYWEAALEDYQQLRRHAPGVAIDVLSRIKLTELLRAAGRQAETVEILRLMLEQLDPATPVGVLVRLARACLASGDRALAEFAVRRALAHPELPVELGQELVREYRQPPRPPAAAPPATGPAAPARTPAGPAPLQVSVTPAPAPVRGPAGGAPLPATGVPAAPTTGTPATPEPARTPSGHNPQHPGFGPDR